MMDSSEQDSARADHYLAYAVTPGTNTSWYYPITYVDVSGLTPTQPDGSNVGDWNASASTLGSVDYLPTPSAAPQTQYWDDLYQGQASYQYTRDAVLPLQQFSSATAPQTPITGASHSTEPNLNPWMWEVAAPMQTGIFTRRPSHHSDPGFPTYSFSQDNYTHHPLPDSLSRTVSDTVTIPRTNIYAPGQSASPPSGPPSTSRPIIRCHDHGCNGRTFSSISNLRRHQRERAGQSAVCVCPRCGAPFYRRWTRDHHVMRMSCLRVPRWRGWSQHRTT